MKTLDDFLAGIHTLLEYLEVIIRGGGGLSNSYSKFSTSSNIINENDGKILAYQLLNWISSDTTKEELSKFVPVHDVSDYNMLAIKLNNKSRNIPQSIGGVIRALAKAISGFMLLRFHEATVKSYRIVINLLSSVTNDYDIENGELELRCCKGIVDTWDKIAGEDYLLKEISTTDLEGLRTIVFKTFIYQAELFINLKTPNAIEDSNRSLSRALEFQHSIPLGLIIYFARKSIDIGKKIVSNPIIMEASKFYFNMALSILDNIYKEKSKQIDPKYRLEIEELRRSVCLLLSFVYMELGESDQALSYIQKIENSVYTVANDEFQSTIIYAKFNIHLKDDNITLAENALKSLLKLPIKYDMAVQAVKTFVDRISQKNMKGSLVSIQDFYYFKLLVNKYPNDPEFSFTRISQIQCLVSFMEFSRMPGTDNSDSNAFIDPLSQQLIDLIEVVISDHSSNLRILSNEHFLLLKKVLVERIQWHRVRHDWKLCIKWCDLLLHLLNESDYYDDFLMFSLHKIDALINFNNIEESYALAISLLSKQPLTTTCLLICFKALAHKLTPKEALSYVQKYLKQSVAIMNISNNNTSGLFLLISCYNIACECKISEDKMSDLKTLIIKEWLIYFINCRAWRNNETKDSDEMTFLKMSCIYLQEIIICKLRLLDDSKSVLALSEVTTQADMEIRTDGLDLSSNHEKNEMNQLNVLSEMKCESVHSDRKLPFGEFNSNNTYLFNLTFEELQSEIIDIIEQIPSVLNAVKLDGCEFNVIGSAEDLEWLGNVLWHIGVLLVRVTLCNFEKLLPCKFENSDEYKSMRLLLGAKFFELAEKIYGSMNIGDRNIITKNQSLCLIISAAARLDAENNTIEKSKKSDIEMIDFTSRVKSSTLSNNLQFAKNNIVKSNQLLRRLIGFEDMRVLKDLKHISLILEFSCLCKCFPPIDSSIIELFVSEKHDEFLDLHLNEIISCANIASQEPSGNVYLVRTMYTYALQICTKELTVDCSMMGFIYCKLIELSSSRQQALECIEEFSQLLFSKATPLRSDMTSSTVPVTSGFNIDDIDYVCSLAYNYGITLLELDQVQLAEKFVMKAKELLPFTSKLLCDEWKNRMQETYEHILNAQNSSNKIDLLCKTFDKSAGNRVVSEEIGADKERFLTADNLK